MLTDHDAFRLKYGNPPIDLVEEDPKLPPGQLPLSPEKLRKHLEPEPVEDTTPLTHKISLALENQLPGRVPADLPRILHQLVEDSPDVRLARAVRKAVEESEAESEKIDWGSGANGVQRGFHLRLGLANCVRKLVEKEGDVI